MPSGSIDCSSPEINPLGRSWTTFAAATTSGAAGAVDATASGSVVEGLVVGELVVAGLVVAGGVLGAVDAWDDAGGTESAGWCAGPDVAAHRHPDGDERDDQADGDQRNGGAATRDRCERHAGDDVGEPRGWWGDVVQRLDRGDDPVVECGAFVHVHVLSSSRRAAASSRSTVRAEHPNVAATAGTARSDQNVRNTTAR